MELRVFFLSTMMCCTMIVPAVIQAAGTESGQKTCYDANDEKVDCPVEGETPSKQEKSSSETLPVYQDNANGTVTDLRTGLIWQQSSDDVPRSWEESADFCSTLSLGGYSDWYLPDTTELKSIAEFGRSYCESSTVFSGKAGNYWTSTIHSRNSANAMTLGFSGGDNNAHPKLNAYSVRCVRKGTTP